MTFARRDSRRTLAARTFVFAWFFIGGCGHFLAPEFFLRIVPPSLPMRLEAVYISGFFELAGAAGLLFQRSRRLASQGLMVLTVAVTPANVYMWQHAGQFPDIPACLLLLRLVFQLVLLWLILLAGRSRHDSSRIR